MRPHGHKLPDWLLTVGWVYERLVEWYELVSPSLNSLQTDRMDPLRSLLQRLRDDQRPRYYPYL